MPTPLEVLLDEVHLAAARSSRPSVRIVGNGGHELDIQQIRRAPGGDVEIVVGGGSLAELLTTAFGGRKSISVEVSTTVDVDVDLDDVLDELGLR